MNIIPRGDKLKFFQNEARFPSHKFEVPKAVIAYIAKQVFCESELYAQYDWNGRTIKAHRVQIREFFEFREATVQDSQDVADWLCRHVLHHNQEWEQVKDVVYPAVSRDKSRTADSRPC